jgi:lipopolysaccharide/colanic/teichoic acid biosynthesis glycosyltransferase
MIRLFDLFFSLVGLILFFPFSVLIAILNSFETNGKPFFIQQRVGKDGKIFDLIKFRTMCNNSGDENQLTIGKRDKRITRFGFFLRKYKLDEIPQLLNVIRGEMSLVGPRPEVPKYVQMYNQDQKKILGIKPGLTDYASILFFYENEILAKSNEPEKTYIEDIIPQKIELNNRFISDPSLRQYFSILWLTIRKIFFS